VFVCVGLCRLWPMVVTPTVIVGRGVPCIVSAAAAVARDVRAMRSQLQRGWSMHWTHQIVLVAAIGAIAARLCCQLSIGRYPSL
jgi:hypothetical protein